MSALDLLLKMDRAKVEELPTKMIELPRLTALCGEKFEVKLRAVNGEKMADIQKGSMSISKKGNVNDLDMYNMQTQMIINGMVEPNLKDKTLLDHYGCTTPKDLIKSLFLAGEISDLFSAIQELSGYEKVNEDEIKK